MNWNGFVALIIDVNPDYIHSQTNESNRVRMMAGKSPVVPDRSREEYVYHVHHIGQRSDSPFAIIPEYDHTGKSSAKVFHQGTSSDKDLHTPEFERQKESFWRAYIKEYDEAKCFVKIPYLNPKSKRKNGH